MSTTAPTKSGDFSLARPAGVCAVTGQPIAPEEPFIAALRETSQGFERLDIKLSAWEGFDRTNIVAHWRTAMPKATAKKKLLVDDAVLCDLLIRLGETTEPAKLCFEVTETAAITNMADATAFVDAMRRHGIRFALDDFGAGASGFSYLKTLKVDYLKIDGQFIRDLQADAIDRATVRCFRDVAATLGTRTIAEFVENEATAHLLREIGIDFGQGYLYHRPEPIDAVVAAAAAAG